MDVSRIKASLESLWRGKPARIGICNLLKVKTAGNGLIAKTGFNPYILIYYPAAEHAEHYIEASRELQTTSSSSTWRS